MELLGKPRRSEFQGPNASRQFFTVFNDVLLLSRDLFSGFDAKAEIRRLLKGEPEGVETPNSRAGFALIVQETELKLRAYFSILPMESDINLGGDSYAQFVAFYRRLLEKALYHRYLAELNDAVGAIFIGEDELLDAAAEDTGSLRTSHNASSRTSCTTPVERRAEPTRPIFLFSAKAAVSDALSCGRIISRPPRVWSISCAWLPNGVHKFLDKISNDIGNGFVQRIKAAWEAAGFNCRSDVSLRSFDPGLPDIDLLVISEEPTLGYVIFVCELKSCESRRGGLRNN